MENKPKSTFTPALLGSCLGVVVSFALIALILVISVVAGSKSSSATVKNNSVLHLRLEGLVPEKSGNVADETSFLQVQDESIGLQRIKDLIAHAATDAKIKGIVIETNSVSMGQASLYSIIKALEKFKESGKFIYSYADSYSQSAYFLSSLSDSIFVNPQGMVDLRGFGSMIPFFKGTLDKLGVKMEIFYAGDFKSASEPFRLEKMSDENRLQIKTFLDEMKGLMLAEIEKNRGIPADSMNYIMNEYLGRSGKRALQYRLVDVVCQKSEFENILRTKLGVKEDKSIPYVSLSKYNAYAEVKEESGKDIIAVVFAEGEISFGEDMNGVITKNKYSKIFQKILKNKNVKAVVLRVNSPGGDAFTSEVIWDYVEKVKAKGIPVVASFGDYAASGGYYISCGADHIVAEPNTLTGSIGVFSMFPNVSSLTRDKLGLQFDTVKTNDLSVALSPFYNLSDKEKMLMQESVLEIYDLFLDRVSKGRKLSLDSTKVIARGRVWSGQKALELGLVDEIGDLESALKKAGELAKVESYKTTFYPTIKEDFFSEIMREINKGQEEEIMKIFASDEERKAFEVIRDARQIMQSKRVQARLPFVPVFE